MGTEEEEPPSAKAVEEEEPDEEDDKQEEEPREGESGAAAKADEGEPDQKGEGDNEANAHSGEEDDAEMKDKDAEEKEEAEKEPEKPQEEVKELEEDDKEEEEKKPRIAEGTVSFFPSDSTMNAMIGGDGKILTALNDGGLQHFVVAARANVGAKAGRYLYEVRVVQVRSPGDGGRHQMPKQILRIGLSIAGSSPFLGYADDSLGFDVDGLFYSGKTSEKVMRWQQPDHEVFGLLINLNPDSPNAFTVSLFRDGVRACPPQKIPEHLRGKALYPTINYKNLVLHASFGTAQFAPLSFKCLTLQQAAVADVEIAEEKKPASGKHELLVPVALPDEGTYEWLDGFLAEHPEYTELSERAILDWAEKSGIPRNGGYEWKHNNDKPGFDTGIRELDDCSVKQFLQAAAATSSRSMVLMDVKANILAASRKTTLEEFAGTDFHKVALVVMGEPPEDFKKKAREKNLEAKRVKAAEAKNKRGRDKDRAKSRGNDRSRSRRGGKEEDDEEKDEKKEKEDASAEKEEDDAEEVTEEVELTEEEKAWWFFHSETEDIPRKDLSSSFAKFCLPEEGESFDEVRYAWQPRDGCDEYIKRWLAEKKLTQRVEEIVPGSWFRNTVDEWKALCSTWKRKHNSWKESPAVRLREGPGSWREKSAKENGNKRANLRPNAKKQEEQKRQEEVDKAKDDGKKKEEDGNDDDEKKDEEKKKAEEDEDKKDEEKTDAADKKKDGDDDGKEEASDGKDAKKESDEKEVKDDKKEEDDMEEEVEAEEKEEELDVDEIDVFALKDVCDIGNGEPLFANFSFEDWELLRLRFELHALVHAFKRDIDDPERPSFHQSHLEFYYNKYFQRTLTLNQYGVESVQELLKYIEDTVEPDSKKSILVTHLSDDTPLDNFMKLTEDGRRERQQAIDTGDETAELKFNKALLSDRERAHDRGGDRKGDRGKGGYDRGHKGDRKGDDRKGGYDRGQKGDRKGGDDRKGDRKGGYRDDYKGNDYKGGGYRGGSDRGGSSRQALPPAPPPRGSSNYDSGHKRPYSSGPQSSHHGGGGQAYKQSRTSSYAGSSHQQSRSGGSYAGGGGSRGAGYSRR